MSAPAPSQTAPRTITIVVADDHRMVRSALEALLAASDDLRVVDGVGDAAGAVRSVAEHRPTVLVLDLTMPGNLTAFDAIPRIRRDFPDTAIVVLTMQREPAFARRALRLGALGYVLKESADTELVEAVRRAADGKAYVAAALDDLADAGDSGSGADALTQREVEVLRLIALGHTNAEIAEWLTLSVRTIESHRAHIQRKLGRWSRAELVSYAIDHHLLRR